MPTYIALLRWSQEGIERVKESPSRLDRARAAIKAVGGELKAFYMTMGSYDMVLICEAPDNASIAKFVLTLGAQGGVRTESLVAFSEEEYRDVIGSLP